MVKTPPFHGGIMGSNPVGVTKTNGNTKSVAVFLSLPGFVATGDCVKPRQNDVSKPFVKTIAVSHNHNAPVTEAIE